MPTNDPATSAELAETPTPSLLGPEHEFPPADPGRDVIAACRRLHAAVNALDHAAAECLGVAMSDLRCLNALEHGPLPPGHIAAALGLTSGSVTALLDRLERKGLVERSRDPRDRRGVLVAATPLVFATLGPLYAGCAQALRATVVAYPVEEQHAAVRHLQDVAAAWEQAATGRD